jgi:hypothetical protein
MRATEWFEILLRVREVPGSILGPLSSDYVLRGFSHFVQVNSGIVSYNRPRPLSPTSQFILHWHSSI